MHWQIAVVLIVVAVVFFGFVRELMSPDLVALSGVGILLASGILGAGDVLAVFSNSAPITIAAMFVLSAALERTGVIDALAGLVAAAATRSRALAFTAMIAGVILVSSFINNTPVVVILTPVVIGLAQTLRLPASKLLIPLSFASILGGTVTLIGTSTNLLVDGVAQQHGMRPFGIFEITGAGMMVSLVGLIYLLIVGRWLLPERSSPAGQLPKSEDRHFMADALIPIDSPLIGQKLDGQALLEKRGLHVVDVIRGDESLRGRLTDLELQAGDRLVVRSKVGDVLGMREGGEVALGGPSTRALELMGQSRETVVMEGVVGPHSRFLHRRVADLNLRRLYGAYILAIHRRGAGLEGNFDDVELRMGDTLLLEGTPASMKRLFEYQELVNLAQPRERPIRRDKAPIAIAAVVLVAGLAAFSVLPIAALALMAAIAVVVLRCLDADEAYSAVRWNILMLIFGMLAIGAAMEKTGAAKLIVETFARAASSLGPVAMLSAVYLITSLLTEIMSNNAAAILLTPIAIGLAGHLDVDPRPFVVAVMFAASASFATPIGYQTNTFVYNAGGYRFSDFMKIGIPLNILLWIASTFIIPLFWPMT